MLLLALSLGAGGVQAQTADPSGGIVVTPPTAGTGTETGPGTETTPAPTGPVKGQTPPKPAGKGGKSISILPPENSGPDYAAWEKLATRAETATEDRTTSNNGLNLLRTQLVDWRSALLVAQNTNSARIATLRTQITALGALPADGVAEAPEIAERRKKLTDQLVRLQAPAIAADEAYRRADGLIGEIDRVLRERQADELLRLWPAPINPANWPVALGGLSKTALNLWLELQKAWTNPSAQVALKDNLPLVLALLVFAVALIWRGRRWIDKLAQRLQEKASARGRRVWALLASLGQIVVPTAGVVALSQALLRSGMLGQTWTGIAQTLPLIGGVIFVAIWLGGRVFPHGPGVQGPLNLSPESRAEGRFHTFLLGVLLGLNLLRQEAIDPQVAGEAGTALLVFPLLVVAGLLLVRMGLLLRRHVAADTAPGEVPSYRNRLIGLLWRGAVVIGVVGPLLAAVGYIAAAAAMVLPAAVSLGLLGLLFILQQLVGDVYGLLIRSEEQAQQGLVPVLVGFALSLCTLPLFALIWGARPADITELWSRFREGFQMGETKVSPTDFLYFLVLFGIGYTLTRLFQGALKSTILPKTSLDQGGQNAIVAGVGYTGIFLAALLSINAVGIDLSGLAIVAGALSLGIGFGLQNIVSNFVSGIILLIERPVSEGDWIEVGNVSGTVRAISVRSTRIQTFDRSDVIVPNADLVTQRVTNWTRFNLTGRLIVPVTVVHGSDTRKVETILRQIAEAQPLAILNPPPVVALMGFSMDGITFEMRLILRDVNFSMNVRSEINHAVVQRFAEAGIELAHTLRPVAPRRPARRRPA
ncbi:DUF3772 domain-containing protein, partial [Rhodobacter ferrooxidans]|uniref:DUF3772 domain-containing protein n=1 Tax=Rhodobacter ferrooxidans TaxID=371731 RepID=UPI0006811387